MSMSNLMCDEVWKEVDEGDDDNNAKMEVTTEMSKEDCLGTLRMFIEKEELFMPEPGYLDFLKSDDFVRDLRFESIAWLIKTQWRIGLSPLVIFGAMNYLDRFVSKTLFKTLKKPRKKMMRLLAVACLSVSSKFNNMRSLRLPEFQVVEMEAPFKSDRVKKMEVTLMQTLGWKMNSVTPLSYVALLLQSIDADNLSLHGEHLATTVTNLLATSVLDGQVIEYRQSVIAVSAIRCMLDNLQAPSNYKTALDQSLDSIKPQFHKQEEDLVNCERIINIMCRENHPHYIINANLLQHAENPLPELEEHDGNVRNVRSGGSRKRKRWQMDR